MFCGVVDDSPGSVYQTQHQFTCQSYEQFVCGLRSCSQAVEGQDIEHLVVLEILEVLGIPTARQKNTFNIFVRYLVTWVFRALNSQTKLQNDLPQNISLPYSDYRLIVSTYLRKPCSDFWTQKVHKNAPLSHTILHSCLWVCCDNCREELLLYQTSIGHTLSPIDIQWLRIVHRNMSPVRYVSRLVTYRFIL